MHQVLLDPVLVLDRRQQSLERMDFFPIAGEAEKKVLRLGS